MYLICGILQCVFFLLVLLSTQPIFGEIIRFNDGEIIYEYDNSSTPLGRGAFGTVYEGIRMDGNQTENVVFKELRSDHVRLLKESNISEVLGQHDSFPTFYRYFPETNETNAVFVMERIGKTLYDLWKEFRPFSPITAVQVGLEILNALGWMHDNGITHNDLHIDNVAVGYHNKSKIYLFDFSLAEMNDSRPNTDLPCASRILNEMLLTRLYDEECRNNALKEVYRIAKEYRNISDDVYRNKTFAKLKSILITELDSHKNDADYEKYVDISHIQDAVDGMTLLRKFIKQNDTTSIENLLQSDQTLNVNAGFGNSSYFKPIHLAAELGNASVVQLLLEHGAELNIKYNETHCEKSPLHFAAENGNAEMVRLLLENGAELDAKYYYGSTPLYYAVSNRNTEVALILIEHGADYNVRFYDGKTMLHCAAENGDALLVRCLIENDVEINVMCNNGRTPLQCAIQKGNADVVNILREAEQKFGKVNEPHCADPNHSILENTAQAQDSK